MTARLALLCSTQFMVILDTTIVTVALPSIRTDLDFGSAAGLQYVVSLYALTFGGTLVLAGRAGDRWGRRRTLTAGLVAFAAASLGCAVAPTPAALLAARAVQGLGGAVVSATALALVTTLHPEGRERTRALGAWGAASGAAGASGLVLGGLLTSGLGWPAVFLVNVPLGALAAALTLRLLPADARAGHSRLDLPGAVTVTTGLGALLWACTVGGAGRFVLLAVAAALFAVFVRVERRSAEPLVRFRLFRLPGVAVANVVALLLTTVVASNLFFTTLYVQQALDFTPLQTGLAFLPNSALVVVGSAVGSRVIARTDTRPVLAGGLTVLTAANLTLSLTSGAGVLAGFALTGLGLGLAFVAVTVAATRGVDRADQGLASGLVNTAQQLGFAVGIAAVVAAAASPSAGYLVDAGIAAVAVGVGSAGRRPVG